ncbi:MAG: hypothetical protein KatS3mg096_624 [Candidatus Parcubacteria bacterium]|nr:MAG: hypothetical protein KatS3mg096_624 [Candidatus Parcubacteria bacterium]
MEKIFLRIKKNKNIQDNYFISLNFTDDNGMEYSKILNYFSKNGKDYFAIRDNMGVFSVSLDDMTEDRCVLVYKNDETNTKIKYELANAGGYYMYFEKLPEHVVKKIDKIYQKLETQLMEKEQKEQKEMNNGSISNNDEYVKYEVYNDEEAEEMFPSRKDEDEDDVIFGGRN